MAKVLIIDDDLVICDMFAIALRQAGYEVDCAGSGKSAYDLIMNNKFNATLLDLMMPGMTGIELISKIVREKKRGNMGKVMVFTSLDKNVVGKKLDVFKVVKYLDKSEITPNELVDEMKKVVPIK